MGRAAIYARVSTDERAVSLDAQEDGARAWAHREGHAVTHVYRDDGVSGAEWVRRPALARLRLDAASTPRPWDVLVVRDLDRLGRDSIRLPVLLDDLARVGASVVEWSSGRVVQLTGADLLVTTLRAGLAQLEREAIAHRTRTALQQRAERGQVTGGCVYGYRNVRTVAGVHYEPHEAEAATVVEIYRRHAEGESARMIARSLTARGVAAPRGAPSWAPATVHAILRSERYRGAATWGRVGAEYQGGERKTVRRADVVSYQVPALVSPELWTAAQARATPARAASGRRSALSREPRYLLVGHAVCGHCGGPLGSWRTTHGSGPMAAGRRTVVQTYRCGWRATRGPEACGAAYMRPMQPLDRGIIASLAAALQPGKVRAALDRARELLRPEALDAERAELELRVRAAERSVARLTDAIAHGGGDVPELLSALRAARDELTRARGALDARARPAVVDLATERAVLDLAADTRAALLAALDLAHGGHAEAMQALRALLGASLVRPLRAEWDGAEMTLASEVRPGALLAWREGAGANTGGFYDPNGN